MVEGLYVNIYLGNKVAGILVQIVTEMKDSTLYHTTYNY